MFKLNSPAIRIGLCIAALTVTILLVSDLVFKILPDQGQQLRESRKLFCESVAVQFSSLIESADMQSVEKIMQRLVMRNDDVVSMGLRLNDGDLVANTKVHLQSWDDKDTNQSTLNQVRVPIFKQGVNWATVEVKFQPPQVAIWTMIKKSPLIKFVLITLTLGFLVYAFFIRRTLRILDPTSVVPDRVKAALDQLVEGVVLLDESLSIVLANDAFINMTQRPINKLIGYSLSSLVWNSVNKDDDNLPWEQLRQHGNKLHGVRLLLNANQNDSLILSCNAAAILDDKGKQRGMIVSFDDISEVERTNEKLIKTIAQLEDAEQKIRNQNNELRKIASIDSLTGLLNRGAFFEKLNTEFMLARQEKLELSCIMADIDHFKSVNDTFGHSVGDEVIKGMANVLQDNCGKNGAVGRYGGEEFCLVLPSANIESAIETAENIRKTFAAWSEKQNELTDGKLITSSLGVSSINLGAEDAAEMVNQADKALYESKTTGRNRVSRWIEDNQVMAVG